MLISDAQPFGSDRTVRITFRLRSNNVQLPSITFDFAQFLRKHYVIFQTPKFVIWMGEKQKRRDSTCAIYPIFLHFLMPKMGLKRHKAGNVKTRSLRLKTVAKTKNRHWTLNTVQGYDLEYFLLKNAN